MNMDFSHNTVIKHEMEHMSSYNSFPLFTTATERFDMNQRGLLHEWCEGVESTTIKVKSFVLLPCCFGATFIPTWLTTVANIKVFNVVIFTVIFCPCLCACDFFSFPREGNNIYSSNVRINYIKSHVSECNLQ